MLYMCVDPKDLLTLYILVTQILWCSPSVSECYQSLTVHQHRKGHTVPKQVTMIATSVQLGTSNRIWVTLIVMYHCYPLRSRRLWNFIFKYWLILALHKNLEFLCYSASYSASFLFSIIQFGSPELPCVKNLFWGPRNKFLIFFQQPWTTVSKKTRPRGLDALLGHLLVKRTPVMNKLGSTNDHWIFKSKLATRLS